MLAGLGLAALWQGEQTLAPAALSQLAAAAPGDAQFIGITVGALLAGILLPSWRSPSAAVAGLPLAVGLVTIVPHVGAGSIAAGLAVGAAPWLAAALAEAVAQRAGRSAGPLVADPTPTPPRMTATIALLAVAAALASWFGPLVVAAVLLLLLVWHEWWPRRGRAVPWWPSVASSLRGGDGWPRRLPEAPPFRRGVSNGWRQCRRRRKRCSPW